MSNYLIISALLLLIESSLHELRTSSEKSNTEIREGGRRQLDHSAVSQATNKADAQEKILTKELLKLSPQGMFLSHMF